MSPYLAECACGHVHHTRRCHVLACGCAYPHPPKTPKVRP